jgi:hypothetical protein
MLPPDSMLPVVVGQRRHPDTAALALTAVAYLVWGRAYLFVARWWGDLFSRLGSFQKSFAQTAMASFFASLIQLTLLLITSTARCVELDLVECCRR